MTEPTIDEMLEWFDTITQWIHDKPEYKAIRAILERERDRGDVWMRNERGELERVRVILERKD